MMQRNIRHSDDGSIKEGESGYETVFIYLFFKIWNYDDSV